MDIRLISSLTSDDENQMAPTLLSTLSKLLDQLPIAYTMRIETACGQVLRHDHLANAIVSRVQPT